MGGGKSAVGLLAVVAGLAGCATTSVSVDRAATTGIEPGDSVAVILGRPTDCEAHAGKECPDAFLAEATEKDFERCLAAAMLAERSDLTVIPTDELRRAAFPGSRFEDAPRSIAALLPLAQSAEFRRRIAALKLRYVLLVRVATETANAKPVFAASSGGVWGVGGEWDRISSVTAEILDLREARQSGALTASSYGRAGFVVPVLVIIPLPPVPYSAMTETEACKALGKAVVEFLQRADG